MASEHLFGLNDLLASEQAVLQATEGEAAAIVRNYPGLIDVMFNLPYFHGDLPAAETPEGLFSFFADSHYLQVPYTAWSLFGIWKRGYYLESGILLRSLLEILAQLRYFHTRADQLESHLHPERSSVRFATMFDAVAPGYYRKYYGLLLSSFAHGKGGQLYFRYDHSDLANRRIRMGNEYVRDHMSWVLNQLLPLLFGFLNLFPALFPANTLAASPDIESDRQDALRWLKNAMSAHRTSFPQSQPWYEIVDQIIRLS